MDQKTKTLELLRADTLVHDDRYQRPLRPKKVQAIADSFDPDLFGMIIVSRRDDDRDYVIDGQHRLKGLDQMGWGDTTTECLVHHGLTPAEEAKIFAETQRKRTALRPTEVFRADLMANDPIARGIKRTVEDVGFTLNLNDGRLDNGHIGCVSVMRDVWRLYTKGPEVLRETLMLLRDAWGLGPGPKAGVLAGVAQFVNLYRDRYDRRRVIHILQSLLQERLLALATEQRRVNSISSQEGVMRIVCNAYNKNLTTNALPDPTTLRYELSGRHLSETKRRKRQAITEA